MSTAPASSQPDEYEHLFDALDMRRAYAVGEGGNHTALLNQALEHIYADHETLRRLWELHHSQPRIGAASVCGQCQRAWPCETRRILAGET